jgi:predicted TIM-barrel fold metal-dependent hydrolase
MNRRARSVLSGRAGVAIIKTLGDLATTGVFERFPRLMLNSVETGVGWLPFFMEQLDDNWKRHRFWADGPILPMLPSEYIRRNVAATMQIDRIGVGLRYEIGVDNIMWSSDYPHTGMDWPNSRWVIDREFDGVPEDEKRLMIGLNFARIYGVPIAGASAELALAGEPPH